MSEGLKRILKWLIKAAAAGLIALLALCALCVMYYNVPVHYTNDTGATEYRWQSGVYYRKGTEGFAFGRTNNDGFINLDDHQQGERVDILLMGSSHMEAMNVPVEENTASRLNVLFGGEKYCYNIGVSGHTLLYCAKHLEAALDAYRPGEYVVIETNTLNFPEGDIEAVLDGSLPDIPSQSGGLVGLIQKLPYLRLFYTKYIKGANADSDTAPADAEGAAPTEVLARIGEQCRARGVTPVVVYHDFVLVDGGGRAYADTDPVELAGFRAACEAGGVVFADVTPDYLEGWEQYHRLPYGFANTAPGVGHMNAWGHELLSRRVYETIRTLEG